MNVYVKRIIHMAMFVVCIGGMIYGTMPFLWFIPVTFTVVIFTATFFKKGGD